MIILRLALASAMIYVGFAFAIEVALLIEAKLTGALAYLHRDLGGSSFSGCCGLSPFGSHFACHLFSDLGHYRSRCPLPYLHRTP